MSHLEARILTVLREGRPYELQDPQGKPISKEEARNLILSEYKVPQDIRQQRHPSPRGLRLANSVARAARAQKPMAQGPIFSVRLSISCQERNAVDGKG